jgi:hypothetical protein
LCSRHASIWPFPPSENWPFCIFNSFLLLLSSHIYSDNEQSRCSVVTKIKCHSMGGFLFSLFKYFQIVSR